MPSVLSSNNHTPRLELMNIDVSFSVCTYLKVKIITTQLFLVVLLIFSPDSYPGTNFVQLQSAIPLQKMSRAFLFSLVFLHFRLQHGMQRLLIFIDNTTVPFPTLESIDVSERHKVCQPTDF